MKYIIIACILLIYQGGGVPPTARQASAAETKLRTASQTCSGEDKEAHCADLEVYAMYPYYTGDSYVYMYGEEQAIDDVFSFAEPFANGFAIVKKDGKAGVINSDGKFIIKPEFDEITGLSDEIICFKAANYYTKEKSSWTIFGKSKWYENHVKYRLYDASGKSFYQYSGRVEFDSVSVFNDRIFVREKNAKIEIFADNGKGRIKSLKTLKRTYTMHPIVDRNSWLRTDGDPDKDLEQVSLCAIDSDKFTETCTETYTLVKNSLGGVIQDGQGRYFMLRDGLEEVEVKDGTIMLTSLLSPEQRETLQQLPNGMKMDWNRPFDDGSVVLRNSNVAYYISLEGKAYELPLHSRVSYLGPDTLILTRGTGPWEMCIYSPVDDDFVLPWQEASLRALGKNRERFVIEKDGAVYLIDRQGKKLSAAYASIKATADPQLYLADKVYIFANDGSELRIE